MKCLGSLKCPVLLVSLELAGAAGAAGAAGVAGAPRVAEVLGVTSVAGAPGVVGWLVSLMLPERLKSPKCPALLASLGPGVGGVAGASLC